MALPTNTHITVDTVGIREDLTDGLYDISPTETPFLSAIAKVKATNTLHEWQTHALAAPVANNAHLEGDDTTADAATINVRLNNQAQIFKKSVTISDTHAYMNLAGRGTDMAEQTLYRTKELKRDMEMSGFANQAKVARASGTAGRLAGMPAWIASNVNNVGSGGADPAGTGADARTDGTETPLTQADFNTTMREIWVAGGNATQVFLSANQVDVAADFVGNNNARAQAEKGKVNDYIDVYMTNQGTVKFQKSRHVRDQDVWILDMSMWAWASVRPTKTKKLGATGDNTKVQITAEGTLECRNELANGLVADCS